MLALVLTLFTGTLAASEPVSEPWQNVPAHCNFVVVVERPRELTERLLTLPIVQAARTLTPVQQALKTTQMQQFRDLVTYYESDLGRDWPAILDAVAGQGITITGQLGDDDKPVVILIRGTDEKAVTRLFESATAFVTAEALKQGQPALKPTPYHGVSTVSNGTDFHAAQQGTVITFSDQKAGLEAALDVATGRSPALESRGPAAARKLFPERPAAWAWADLRAVKSTPEAEEYFATTQTDIFQTIVLGSTIDAVRRADFVALGLTADAKGHAELSVKLPAPRAEMPAAITIHAPPIGKPGSLPLLQPPGTVWSQSFYLDLGKIWTDRATVFNPEVLKEFEEGVEALSKVLPGPGVGELLQMTGPHHRIVIVAPPKTSLYPFTPQPLLPGSAIVFSMRDPELGEHLSATYRAGAAIASLNTGLTLHEDTVEGVEIVSYRFPDARPITSDPDNYRLHSAPAFAVVADSFVIASRPDVIHALIPELTRPNGKSAADVWRTEVSGGGLAQWVADHPQAVAADAIVKQGISVQEAEQQVQQLIAALRRSGQLTLSANPGPEYYEWKLTLTPPATDGAK